LRKAGGPKSGSFVDCDTSQKREEEEATMAEENKTIPLSNVIWIYDER